MKKSFLGLTSVVALSSTSLSALAAPQAVIISGGGSPAGNHHSQYLQTNALTEGLRSRLGSDTVEVFFGIGNRPNSTPILADVHKMSVLGDTAIDQMIAGTIERNSEANDANVRAYFKGIQGRTSKKENFFVFVSDHGMPNQEGPAGFLDNCIDLWAFDPKTKTEKAWAERCLSRSDLESLLPSPKNARNVVYAMSQCYSGGFHRMSVKTDEAKGLLSVNPRVCGFTAAPEDLTASGCTPNADGPNYAGYERYFTKQLIGRDFITKNPVPAGPADTVREAHYAATLEDLTGDIPMSTSDFYLQEWAKLIESGKASLSSKKTDIAALRALVAQGSRLEFQKLPPKVDAKMLTEYSHRLGFVQQMASAISTQWSDARALAQNTELATLRKMVADMVKRRDALEKEHQTIVAPLSKAWQELATATWYEAVLAGRAGLTQEQTQWELANYTVFEKQMGSFSRGAFINTELANLYLTDINLAGRKALYLSQRNARVMNLMRTSSKPQVRELIRRFMMVGPRLNVLEEQLGNFEVPYRYTRRILMMREQLGALYALMTVGAKKEQRSLGGLLDCENSEF